MIRREFLRLAALTSALSTLTVTEAAALDEANERSEAADLETMNQHLWRVYQFARSKRAVWPVVQSQLVTVKDEIRRDTGQAKFLCGVAGDLLQLAGELAYDGNRYEDAAASYATAATVSKEAGSYDLWACALIRSAYCDLSQGHYREAADTLNVARRLAQRGDTALATRHWASAVLAEAHAGLDERDECERALDEAETVGELAGLSSNGGWLRFDGSRLAEERGARYVQLGRLDLAEEALQAALRQTPLKAGHSFRRRGAVLTDLAAIGLARRDAEQVRHYALEAVEIARLSRSGYVVRRLRKLVISFDDLHRDRFIADLKAEIEALPV